jgi:hypothetical protein
LRGDVVVSGVDAAGPPAGLIAAAVEALIGSGPARRGEWLLSRRFDRDVRCSPAPRPGTAPT